MKKLVFFLSLIFVMIGVSAQSTLLTKSVKDITPSAWSFVTSVSAADSIGPYQDSISQPVYLNLADSVKGEIRVKLTERTSPGRVTTQLQVKRFTNDSWTTASTVTYTGVGTDTTFYFRNLAAYKAWPYQRVLFIYVNNKTKISELSGYYKK